MPKLFNKSYIDNEYIHAITLKIGIIEALVFTNQLVAFPTYSLTHDKFLRGWSREYEPINLLKVEIKVACSLYHT